MNETKALECLNKKWTQPKECECCGMKSWQMSNNVVSPNTANNDSIAIGGLVFPQITVTCVNCGNTKYFNAIVLGIIKTDGTFAD